jgi:hypothetical protein
LAGARRREAGSIGAEQGRARDLGSKPITARRREACMRYPTILTIILGCAAYGLPAADTPPAPTPGGAPHAAEAHDKRDDGKIHRAVKALDDAIEDLRKAPHDFGGHKQAAIEACEKAKKELHEAMAFDEKHEKDDKKDDHDKK